ncbi:hypothetical protein C2142_23185 [Streptomyces sp. CB01881]|nr:hypothetical protein C2142_23185 [Streptomyces sp. CB01881]
MAMNGRKAMSWPTVLLISTVKVTGAPPATICAGTFLIVRCGRTSWAAAGAWLLVAAVPLCGAARAAGAVAMTEAEARAATAEIARPRRSFMECDLAWGDRAVGGPGAGGADRCGGAARRSGRGTEAGP